MIRFVLKILLLEKQLSVLFVLIVLVLLDYSYLFTSFQLLI